MQAVPASYGRLAVRSLSAGLVLGIATSVLNHADALGPVAAVFGSGAAWGVFGVAAALLLGVRHPRVIWLRRAGAVALFYLGACLSYYLADWLFSIPSTLRLREEIRSGRLPDPGPANGLSLVPDPGDWFFWSTVSIPAAFLVSGIASMLLVSFHWVRPTGRPGDGR